MRIIGSIFLILLVLSTTNLVYAQPLSSAELINNARQHDGKVVMYAGEVIGEVMLRGQNAWVNIKDGINAIGIWMDKELASEILNTGSYRAKGDWVVVTGIFNRSCPLHGGDLDIHAQELHRTIAGRATIEDLNTNKRNLALVLLGLLCLVLILRPSRRS
jgi:hypothetical protein